MSDGRALSRSADRTRLAFFTLLVIALLPFDMAGAQSAPAPPTIEISDVVDTVSLGRHTLIADLPVPLRDAWLDDPRILLDVDPDKLTWRRNGEDRLWLESPSRLSLLVLDLVSHGQRERDLMLNLTGIDGLGWFYRDHRGDLVSHFDDFSLPRGGRPVIDIRSPMPLRLVPGHPYRVYIAAYTVTDEKHASIVLQDAEAFRQDRLVQHVIDGAYYGLVAMVVIYNLFLAIALRRSVYLYLGLFLAGSAALIYVASGMSQVIGLQNSFPRSLVLVYLFQGMVAVAGALFSMRLLGIEHHSRLPFHTWRAVIALYILVTPVMLYIGRDGGYSARSIGITFDLFALLWLLNQAAYLLTFVYYWNRSRIVRYWYPGVILHTWTLTLWPVLVNSAIDSPVNPYHIAQLVTALNAILLSAVLAYEQRREHLALIRAQQQSVQHLRTVHDIDRARGTFIDTMAHDLRGPLQTIRHFSHSLLPSLPPERHRDVGKIDENVERLTGLIDGMTRLSRTEWESGSLTLESFPLLGLLESLRRDFTPLAAEKGLALEVDTSNAFVLSDRVGLTQILRNLIDNAIKHTRQGTVRVHVEKQNDAVRISVEDTGPGIADDELERIFVPFFQGTHSNSETPGVGLGLAIVDRLVKRLDIPLEVDSSPGQGSRFCITLRRTTASESPVPGALPDLSLSTLQILALRFGTEPMDAVTTRLIEWGATIWPANTLEEARRQQLKTQSQPGLVLLDGPAFRSLYRETPPLDDQLPWGQDTVILVIMRRDDHPIREQHARANLFFVSENIPLIRLRSLIQRYVLRANIAGSGR
ncbi:MAG: sensor histidine kinase [Pseudohongiellaceae bacterium]